MKTDIDLQQQIFEELKNDPDLDVEFLDVRVHEGVVTLSGNLRSDPEKWRADDTVRRVPGVSELVSKLQVTEKEPGLQNADAARPWFPLGG